MCMFFTVQHRQCSFKYIQTTQNLLRWAGAHFELYAIPQVMQSTFLPIAKGRHADVLYLQAFETQRRRKNSKIKKCDLLSKTVELAHCFQPLLYKYKNSCGPENISRVVKQEGLLVANFTFLQALVYFQLSPKCFSTYYRRRGLWWPLHFVIPACYVMLLKGCLFACFYSIWVGHCA